MRPVLFKRRQVGGAMDDPATRNPLNDFTAVNNLQYVDTV